MGYLSSEFTDEFLSLGDDLDGRDAALAPDFSGNIALDYYAPVSEGLAIGLGTNVRWTTDHFTGNSNFSVDQDGYATVDAYVSLGTTAGGWELTLIGSNLGDEQIITNSGNRPFLPPDGDDNVVTFNRGRTVALNLGIRF